MKAVVDKRQPAGSTVREAEMPSDTLARGRIGRWCQVRDLTDAEWLSIGEAKIS